MNGCLGGLVSVTGSCGVIEPWAAVITGFVAGLLYLSTSKLLIRLRIGESLYILSSILRAFGPPHLFVLFSLIYYR